jgi:hypothetical protein
MAVSTVGMSPRVPGSPPPLGKADSSGEGSLSGRSDQSVDSTPLALGGAPLPRIKTSCSPKSPPSTPDRSSQGGHSCRSTPREESDKTPPSTAPNQPQQTSSTSENDHQGFGAIFKNLFDGLTKDGFAAFKDGKFPEFLADKGSAVIGILGQMAYMAAGKSVMVMGFQAGIQMLKDMMAVFIDSLKAVSFKQ